MPDEVIRTIASVGCSIVGSGTSLTRTSRGPCHVTAFIEALTRLLQLARRLAAKRGEERLRDPRPALPARRLPRSDGSVGERLRGGGKEMGGDTGEHALDE